MLTRRRALWALPLLLLAVMMAAALFALTPAQPADAQQATQTFVANLGQADGFNQALGNDYAVAFTTGSNAAGYSLRSVDVEFGIIHSSFSSSDLTASIHTESSGSPGSSLGTLTNPASFPVSSSDQTLTFTSTGIDLSANTTYFLVLDLSRNLATSGIRATNSNNEDSGALAGWSIGNGLVYRAHAMTGAWFTNTPTPKISLDGVVKTATMSVELSTPQMTGELSAGAAAGSFRVEVSSALATATYFRVCITSNRPTLGLEFEHLQNTVLTLDENGCADLTVSAGSTERGISGFAVGSVGDVPNEVISVTLSEDPDNPLPAGVSIDTSANSFTYTLHDDDPTVVTLARVGSGAVSEGGTVEFTVTLGRALIAGETIDVPLSIGGTGVTTSDWSLAKKTGTSLNTGVTLSGTSTATPTVRFSGAGARTATLELTPVVDGATESTETYTIALGSNAAFDASSLGTNVGGGADPHATSNGFSVQVSNKPRPSRVSILGGGAVTEGASASFTLRASPAPPADLPVSVTVTTTGDFGYGALPTSVTIPASGSATLEIPTTNDDVDEAHGSVTVTLVDGSDYDLATSLGTATVRVRDDDPPLVKNTGQSSGLVQGLHVDLAQGFDTGGNPSGYTLTSVDVAFNRSTEDFGSKLTVTVHKGANGAPGTVVGTLANPAFVNRQAGTYRFTHPGVALEAETRYWVVLDAAGLTEGNSQVKFTQSNSEDEGAAPGWSINNDARIRAQGGGNWITLVGGSTLSMGVNGRLLPHADGSYTVPLDWPLKPLGVGAGETFRLLFMTEDHRDATAADIGVYDAHVREAARDGHAAVRRYADHFRVVGSTAAVDARDHTRTNPNDAGHTDAPRSGG